MWFDNSELYLYNVKSQDVVDQEVLGLENPGSNPCLAKKLSR